MKEIKIKYHVDIPKLKKIERGDWIDLYAAEDVVIRVGEFRLISLGVSMKLPEGYEAHIVPRSSTFKRWGIIQTNHVGIIDNSYSGENDVWRFPAYCLIGKEDGGDFSHISKGDRICQFRIVKQQPKVSFVEVDKMNDPDRGGFGSTGL